eukprot:scaffold1843_cov89-Skeletonema_marinoi.AAC.4
MAEGWIQVNQYGELLNPPIGIEAILSTLYAAFTFMSEGRRDENDKPRAPTFDVPTVAVCLSLRFLQGPEGRPGAAS